MSYLCYIKNFHSRHYTYMNEDLIVYIRMPTVFLLNLGVSYQDCYKFLRAHNKRIKVKIRILLEQRAAPIADLCQE